MAVANRVSAPGLLTATVSSEVFKAAQPALLYLVPFTLLPLFTMAYIKVNYAMFVFALFCASFIFALLSDVSACDVV